MTDYKKVREKTCFFFVRLSFVVVQRGRLQIEDIDVVKYSTQLHSSIVKMKRSLAPSNKNTSFKKKPKAERLKETAVRMPPPPPPRVAKQNLTPLNAKQLKSLQYLLCAAAYASVLESSTTNGDGLRDKCYKNYHGSDDDHIGVVQNFLEGNDRYSILWDSGRIASGFGNLSGLCYQSIEEVIFHPTLKGKSLLTGRQVLEKARECLKGAKKYLAYWMEFLVAGSMPSGMNEVNALQYVMKRIAEEMSSECPDGDEEEGTVSYFVCCLIICFFFSS
jgi:hypothetical protein